jgi:hypothetical protein
VTNVFTVLVEVRFRLEKRKKLKLILNKHVSKNRVLVGKAERLGRPRGRWEGGIKMDL